MSDCVDSFVTQACFVETDSGLETALIKYLKIDKDNNRNWIYALSTSPDTPLTNFTNIGGQDGKIVDRPCGDIKKQTDSVECCYKGEFEKDAVSANYTFVHDVDANDVLNFIEWNGNQVALPTPFPINADNATFEAGLKAGLEALGFTFEYFEVSGYPSDAYISGTVITFFGTKPDGSLIDISFIENFNLLLKTTENDNTYSLSPDNPVNSQVAFTDYIILTGKAIKFFNCDDLGAPDETTIEWRESKTFELLDSNYIERCVDLDKYETDGKEHCYNVEATKVFITTSQDGNVTKWDEFNDNGSNPNPTWNTYTFNPPVPVGQMTDAQMSEAYKAIGFTDAIVENYEFTEQNIAPDGNGGGSYCLTFVDYPNTQAEADLSGYLGGTNLQDFDDGQQYVSGVDNQETTFIQKKSNRYHLCGEDGLPDPSTFVYKDCDTLETIEDIDLVDCKEEPKCLEQGNKEACYDTEKEAFLFGWSSSSGPFGTTPTSYIQFSYTLPTGGNGTGDLLIPIPSDDYTASTYEATIIDMFEQMGYTVDYLRLVDFSGDSLIDNWFYFCGKDPEGRKIVPISLEDLSVFVSSDDNWFNNPPQGANDWLFYMGEEGTEDQNGNILPVVETTAGEQGKACMWYGCGEDGKPDISTIEWRDSKTLEPLTPLQTESLTDCVVEIEDEPKKFQIMTVRLDGNTTNSATAKPEGIGLVSGDIGNTFTLPADSYYTYNLVWLGDTEQNAIVDWNGASYRAGIGSGSAGYAHAELPLREWTNCELGCDEIIITAQTDAYLELRFTQPI